MPKAASPEPISDARLRDITEVYGDGEELGLVPGPLDVADLALALHELKVRRAEEALLKKACSGSVHELDHIGL